MEKLRKFLAGLSVMTLLASVVGFGAIASAQFSDVPEDHWAYSYVEQLATDGVIDTDNDAYRCDDTINRAEVAKLISLAFALDAGDYDPGFTDVKEGDWFYEYVAAVAKHGIVSGDTDADGEPTGIYRPGDAMNRAEAGKVAVLAAGLTAADGTGDVFSDVDAGDWFASYVETSYWYSIIDGYGDGKYGPSDRLTRCQFAKVTVNAENPVYRGDDDDDDDTTGDDDDDDTTGDDDDDDTTGDDDDDDVVESSGNLTVALGDVIAGGSIPKGATGVEMLNVMFTGATEAVTVTELVIKREGVGSSADFSKIYLYQDGVRLTSGKTISSDSNTAIFGGMTFEVEPGETETLTVVADYAAAATASNQNNVSVVSADSITHNGVGLDGTFPIKGEIFSVAGASAGSITISKTGSLDNPTIGQEETEVAKFQLEASNENLSVTRIALRLRGSISDSEMTNFKLWYSGTEIGQVDGVSGDKDLITFEFDTPIALEDGDNRTYTVTADIGASVDANDVILINLDENTDLVAIGAEYGYGATVTATAYDGNTANASTSSCITVTWEDASCTTVQGGQATLSFKGPASDEVAINGKDVTFFRFSLKAEEYITVKQLVFNLAITTADSTSDAGDLLNGTTNANFTDIKMVDEDTGSTVLSAQDLSTSGSDITQNLTYTDEFIVKAGATRNFKLTMDVRNNTSLDNEVLTVTLNAIASGDIENSVGEAVTDIVPSGNIAGNGMTIESPSLAITLASDPPDNTFVSGNQDTPLVGFAFKAGDAADVTVTSIAVTGYLDENADSTFVKTTDNNINISSVLDNLRLYDEDDNEISTKGESISSTSGKATFTNLNWTIPAGETKKVIVKGDLNSNAPYNSTNDSVGIDLDDVSADVTANAEDGSSTTVTATGDDPNGALSPSTVVTIREAGQVTISAATNPVEDDKVVGGTAAGKILVARYDIVALHEDFQVTDFTVINNSSYSSNSAVNTVYLHYPTSLEDRETLDGVSSAQLNTSGQALFSNMTMMVPQSTTNTTNQKVTVELYVTTNQVATVSSSGKRLEFDFDADGAFRAVGQGSSTTIVQTSASTLYGNSGGSDIDVNDIALYVTLPTFAYYSSNLCSGTLNQTSTDNVYCFSISANSAGDVGVYKLKFNASPNLLSTGTSSTQLAASNGFKLYDIDTSGGKSSTVLASGTWADSTDTVTLTFSSEEVISAGKTQYYVMEAPIEFNAGSSNQTPSISVFMNQDTSFAANAAAASVSGSNVWSDRSATSHSFTTTDWTNSYKLETLPTTTLKSTQ